ncbi:MAG: SGNH/GDSL hydrolase family protein [Fulvivirga sp.]
MISRSFVTFLLILVSQFSFSQDSLSFLALGDSYTIGESVSESSRWPVQLADSLNIKGIYIKNPVIIARTGWRTDELKQAIEDKKPEKNYDLVGLLIGVNNQYQGKSPESYRSEFEELLDIAIAHANGNKSRVFVVSIPDYGYTPFGKKSQEKISNELDVYNNINKAITEGRGVKYFYITDISRQYDATLVAEDGLHPSGKQYALWVQEILNEEQFINSLR